MDDAELVAAARAGEADAFGAIYDRFADRIHDYCRSFLHDPGDAADAMHDTFVVAMRRLDTLRNPSRLRPWLYAIARNECLHQLAQRDRVAPSDPQSLDGAVTDEPERAMTSDEATEIVWSAAQGLAPRDRQMLDLHLRHELDASEIAEALGVSERSVPTHLHRLRARMERALSALLVARVGRDDCPELDAILGDWDGGLTPLIRKRVARHIDGCEICGATKRRHVSPLALLGAVPLVPAAPALRERIVADMATAATSARAAGGEMHAASRWQPRLVRVAAVAAVTAAVVGTIAFATRDGDAPQRAAPLVTSISTTTVVRGPTRPTTTIVATSTTGAPLSTTTTISPTGTLASPVPVPAPPPGSTSAPTLTAAPAPTTTPPTTAPPTSAADPSPRILAYDASPSPAPCPGTTSVTLTWQTSNATEVVVSIDGPGAYDTYGPNTAVDVPYTCDGAAHSYMITANGPDGSASRTIAVQPG